MEMESTGKIDLNGKKFSTGEVLVQLRKLRKKYSELEHNRKVFRQSVSNNEPGAYEGYKVIQIKEVKVRSYVRKAHRRIIISK